MFKLLTEDKREDVEREYRRRRLVVVYFALSAVCLVGLVSILPAYILSVSRWSEAQERVRIATESGGITDEAKFREWARNASSRLTILSPRLDTDRPSEDLNDLLSERSVGISLTSLMWEKSDEGVSISASGVASSRDVLINFESRVSESDRFSNVVLPVSSLAQESEIDFHITLDHEK